MSILKIILIQSMKYLLILVNMVKEDKISNTKDKNIKKYENEIIKILAKLKSWNLLSLDLEICLSLKILLKFKTLLL